MVSSRESSTDSVMIRASGIGLEVAHRQVTTGGDGGQSSRRALTAGLQIHGDNSRLSTQTLGCTKFNPSLIFVPTTFEGVQTVAWLQRKFSRTLAVPCSAVVSAASCCRVRSRSPASIASLTPGITTAAYPVYRPGA